MSCSFFEIIALLHIVKLNKEHAFWFHAKKELDRTSGGILGAVELC